MTNRRSFFSRLARAAAIIALAPQIAFRAPKIVVALEQEPKLLSFWMEINPLTRCYSDEYLEVYNKAMSHAEVSA